MLVMVCSSSLVTSPTCTFMAVAVIPVVWGNVCCQHRPCDPHDSRLDHFEPGLGDFYS